MQKKLILGSSSPYRKKLFSRLNLPFDCLSPNINESPKEQESARQLVQRLSIEKALAVHQEYNQTAVHQDAIIIASDQVAILNGKILGKPVTEENAINQLKSFSGQKVSFLTGLCLFNQEDESHQYEVSEYHVYFRQLTIKEIKNYIRIEQPLQCAGSFMCEGLGVSLFERMEGQDPNSLVGLPLISLCRLLREYNVNPIG